MSNPWFRMYSDFIHDEKIEFISFEDQRHFVFILCMKNLGLIDKEYSSPEMLDRVIARRLGLYGEAFDSAKKRLIESGLVDSDWQPVNWNKRQFISDLDPTRAERQRKHRNKQRNLDSNALRNGSVTVLDTDTEEETDIYKHSATPVGFAAFWDSFPRVRRGSKTKCEQLWHRKKLESKAEEILRHLTFKLDDWEKENFKFAPGALPYLNKEEWDGWEGTAQVNPKYYD